MSDPIAELRGLEDEMAGPPLSAAEVRRRGDRLRRRPTALVAVAAAAPVAPLALPVAVVGGNDRSAPPRVPSPTATPSRPSGDYSSTTPSRPAETPWAPPDARIDDIPADFPLAPGWPPDSAA